jgi:hypothetical protein
LSYEYAGVIVSHGVSGASCINNIQHGNFIVLNLINKDIVFGDENFSPFWYGQRLDAHFRVGAYGSNTMMCLNKKELRNF